MQFRRLSPIGKEHSGADNGCVGNNVVRQSSPGVGVHAPQTLVNGHLMRSNYNELQHSSPSSPRVGTNSCSSVGRPASPDTVRAVAWNPSYLVQRVRPSRPQHGHSTPTISHRLSLSGLTSYNATLNSASGLPSPSQGATPATPGSCQRSPVMSRRSSAPGTPRVRPPQIQLDGKSFAFHATVRETSSDVDAAQLKQAPELGKNIGELKTTMDPHIENLTGEFIQNQKTVDDHLSLQDLEIAVLRDHFDELSKNVDMKMASILQHLTNEIIKERDKRLRDVEHLQNVIVDGISQQHAQAAFLESCRQATKQSPHSTHVANERQDEVMPSCVASNEFHRRLEFKIGEMEQQLQQIREQCMDTIAQSTSDLAVRLSRVENFVGQLRCEKGRESLGVCAAQQVVCDKPAAEAAAQIPIDEGATTVSDAKDVRNLCDLVQGFSGALSDLSRNVDTAWKQTQSQVEATKLHAERLQRQFDQLVEHVPSELQEVPGRDSQAAREEGIAVLLRDDREPDLAAKVLRHAASP